MPDERQALIETIRSSIIGRHHEIDGPFGPRLVTYADYTASGRSLSFIEDFLRDHVLPYYANTHTESSGTGLQTTRFREEARRVIHQAVGGSDEDVVIFTGSGATGAINKLVAILNLRIPADLNDRYDLDAAIPTSDRPVVFIGPYEHHSNELPWRESIADVVVIDEDPNGRPDLEMLERELVRHADRPLQDRQLLGGVERHRHRLEDQSDLDSPAPPRGARVLGLRGRGALRQDRDEPHRQRPTRLQGRGLPLTAQVHRRPRHARRAGRQAASCSPTRSPPSRAAARSRTSTRWSTATSPTPRTARRAARRRSSSRSAPDWPSS